MLTCRGGVHWASLRRRAATELAARARARARTCCSASSSQCWRSTVSDASPGAMGALAATCCGSAGGAGLAACSPGWAPKGFSESSHDIALKAPWRVRLGKVRDGHWGRRGRGGGRRRRASGGADCAHERDECGAGALRTESGDVLRRPSLRAAGAGGLGARFTDRGTNPQRWCRGNARYGQRAPSRRQRRGAHAAYGVAPGGARRAKKCSVPRTQRGR